MAEEHQCRRASRPDKKPRVHRRGRLIRTILVPTDFSDCSLAGLRYAVRLAREIGARITVLHVTDLGPVMMSTPRGEGDAVRYAEAARRRCGDRMQAFLKRVDVGGVGIDAFAVAGYCPGAIYDAAASAGADLIVMSTHGRTGLRRALVGSVTEATVRQSECAVLVVPAFAKAHESSMSGKQPPAIAANIF